MIGKYDYMAFSMSKAVDFCAIVLCLIFFTVLLCIVWNLAKPRKSEYYRKLLSDMYVVGMIKKFATEDNLDLDKEEQLYKHWLKKRNLVTKDVDKAIEEELKHKIADKNASKFKL